MKQQLITPPSIYGEAETVQKFGKEFQSSKHNSIEIYQGKRESKSFNRLTVKSYGFSFYRSFEMDQVKEISGGRTRRTEISIELNKEQIELLVENLQAVLAEMNEQPATV